MKRRLFVGLGSNFGDRESHIRKATKLLEKNYELTADAKIRETDPQNINSESKFLNTALELETSDVTSAVKLLDQIHDIESKAGRNRQTEPDRRIDVDLLYWGSLVIRGNPHIPHPRIHLRKFVLEPMNDIAPEFRHPIFGQTQRQLLRKLT